MRLGVVAATLLTAAGLGAAYAAGAFGGGSDPRVAQGAPPSPSPAELRVIERLALRQAAAAGDPHPSSGVVVPTTRKIAERVDAGDPSEPSTPAYFVLLHGEFTGNEAPDGAALPTGSILTMTIDAKRNTVTDGGIADRMPDVDAIGRAVQLTLPDLAAGAPSLSRDLALTRRVPCRPGPRHQVGRRALSRFHAVTAVSCTEGFRTYPGQGQWEVLIRRVAVGRVWRLQRAFERPDERHVPKNVACAAVRIVIPIPTFVDDGGHWLAPRRWPVDGCGQPLGYDYKTGPPIRWHVVSVRRIKQLVTAAAVAANCPMRMGNTVAWAGPPHDSVGGDPFTRTPKTVRICVFRTPPNNFATGNFVRGFRLGPSRTRRLLGALTGPGPRRGCPKQRTFATVGGGPRSGATVELGGCYRVERPDRTAGTANRAVVRAILGER